MGLSMIEDCPDDVLARGTHLSFEWVVMRGPTRVFRCGYIRVPRDHPWAGRDREEIEARVHGGLTWSEFDFTSAGVKGGYYWIGFDCGHARDLPDLDLVAGDDPTDVLYRKVFGGLYGEDARMRAELETIFPMTLWTQSMVEAECLSLCEQAAEAAEIPGSTAVT